MYILDSKIAIPEDVLFYEVSNQVDDEMVILNLATSQYYSLDEIGTRMWLLIHEHSQLKAVHQVMLEEYAVEPQATGARPAGPGRALAGGWVGAGR